MTSRSRALLYRTAARSRRRAALTARRLAALRRWRALSAVYAPRESFGFDDGRLKTADYHTDAGFGLRGVSGETTAFAHANEISAAAIRRAARDAEAARSGEGPRRRRRRRAPTARLYTADDPLDARSRSPRRSRCARQIDAAARARDPRVAQVSVALSRQLERGRDRPRRRLRRAPTSARWSGSTSQIVAEQNGRRETGSFGLGGRYLYDRPVRAGDLEPRDRRGAGARRWSTSKASPRPAGEMPVRARPRLARRPAARGGRPRPRGRLQPQGHLGLLRPDRRARRRARRDGGRRRRDRRPPRLAHASTTRARRPSAPC